MRKYIFWFLLASAVLTACDAEPVKVSVTMESDYSQIIDAINSANQTLTTKMALIESALSQGFADNKEAQELLRQAIASLSGTAAEKLAAIEAAVKSQTASLELKLGLIEAAISGGFADAAAQQKLIESTIQALSGTAEEKLALIEGAIKSQTTGLETKLGLIEAAISSSLAEASSQQELLCTALASLQGTLEEKLSIIEAAVKSQTVSLETKLGLIELSLSEGLSGEQQSLALIQEALDALDGTLEAKLASVETAIKSETAGLEGKLALIEAAAKKGFADAVKQQGLIQEALEALSGSLDAKLTALSAAVTSRQTELDTKLGVIDAAVRKGFTDRKSAQSLMLEALQSLEGDASAKLASITSAVSKETASLWAKLVLIETAFSQGLSDEATAIGLIAEAINTSASTGNVAGIVAQIQQMDTTLNEKVAGVLSDIFTGVDTLAEYPQILIAIKRALYNLTDHSINNHEYIEMGPGRKWATMNVGATLPEEAGDYDAWGELDPKAEYSWKNYKHWEYDANHFTGDSALFITKYQIEDGVKWSRWYQWGESDLDFKGDNAAWLGDPQYNFADDVARQDWRDTWRIPTMEDWKWLLENCTWEWTTDYKGKRGMLITSYIPGFEFNQIFLPANSFSYNSSGVFAGNCYYWSSTLSTTSLGYILYADHEGGAIEYWGRFQGFPVRPVSN